LFFFLFFFWFFFLGKIQLATCHGDMWPFSHTHWNTCPCAHVDYLHAATWTRVINTSVRTATCIHTRGHTYTFINPRGRIITRVHMAACTYYTWPSGCVDYLHVAVWPCGLFTCGHMATCNKYTCPNVSQLHFVTSSVWHVANWTHGYSNRYCSHVVNCWIFCNNFYYHISQLYNSLLNNIYLALKYENFLYKVSSKCFRVHFKKKWIWCGRLVDQVQCGAGALNSC
jgi:hypothetical protein